MRPKTSVVVAALLLLHLPWMFPVIHLVRHPDRAVLAMAARAEWKLNKKIFQAQHIWRRLIHLLMKTI